MSTDAASEDLLDQLIEDWRRERPELDASAMGVVGRLLQLGRRLEARAGLAIKPFGLPYSDLDVLATLRRRGEPYQMTPTELRQSILLSSGAMTALLDRLEAKRLLIRMPDPADRRVRSVALTPAGIKLIDRAIEVRFEEAHSALAGLEPAEREQLADLLRKLVLTL
ncbi:MAG: MarR family transcriptional regulator [Acidobacteriota bacterium]